MEHPADLVSQAKALIRFVRDLLMEQREELLISVNGVFGLCLYLSHLEEILAQAQKSFEAYLSEDTESIS